MTLPTFGTAGEETPFAKALAAAGLRVLEEAQAGDPLLAELAAARLGYPLWVRSAGPDDPRFCARLENGDDLALAFVQAKKRSGAAKVLLQPAVEGPSWRLWCNTRDEKQAVIALEAGYAFSPPYCILDHLVLPPEAPEYVVRMAEALRAAPPMSARWLEAEVILAEDGPVLTALWQSGDIAPAVQSLLQPGEDTLGPWRALSWLQTKSGRVSAVQWVDAARNAPGVIEVRVGVRAGDELHHALDEASRNHTGYAVAAGYAREQAIERAREAARRVQIVASAMLA